MEENWPVIFSTFKTNIVKFHHPRADPEYFPGRWKVLLSMELVLNQKWSIPVTSRPKLSSSYFQASTDFENIYAALWGDRFFSTLSNPLQKQNAALMLI